jgi:hypothetical protein
MEYMCFPSWVAELYDKVPMQDASITCNCLLRSNNPRIFIVLLSSRYSLLLLTKQRNHVLERVGHRGLRMLDESG